MSIKTIITNGIYNTSAYAARASIIIVRRPIISAVAIVIAGLGSIDILRIAISTLIRNIA